MRSFILFGLVFISISVQVPAEPTPITVFAGNGEPVWSGLGESATSTALPTPNGLALDSDGRVLIAEADSNQVFRVSPDGLIEIVAGCGFSGFAGDGGPAIEAFLAKPYAVIACASGAVLVADQWNHRIREIDAAGTIQTVAGSGEGFFGLGAFSGDGGPASKAAFNFPSGMVRQGDGTLFIADQMNSRVRRVTPDGVVTTFAGPDGVIDLPLHRPIDLHLLGDGSLLIVDAGTNQIYSASTTGTAEILIGPPISESMTPKHPGIYLNFPVAVEASVDGTLYWAESKNNRVCRLKPGAREPEVLMEGPRAPSLSGGTAKDDDGDPKLGRPTDLLLTPDGALLVADPESRRVWRIALPAEKAGSSQG